MLAEHALKLLTAYVDGVLSSHQRKHVERLLQKSPEARQILKELQDNARQIQQLPKRSLEPAFAGQVIEAIKRQSSQRPAVARRRLPTWTRYAIAASLLAVVAGGIWLANRGPQAPQQPGPIANKSPEARPHVDHSALVARIAAGAADEFARPLLPERTAGARLAFDELAKTQWHEHWVSDMTRQKSVHLDLTVSNQRQAAQRLETVLQNKGIYVQRDRRVESMLKAKDNPPTEFVIYAENVRPDELAAMLYELGTDERARTSIESLTVSQGTDDDQKRLGNLLGISADELREPPASKLPLGTFIPKDQAQPGKGDSNPVRAPSGSDRRIAMVLANEFPSGNLSSEVRSFVAQRRQLQPGALQVIVVVHRA